MDFNQAAKLMSEGKAVQSLVSFTTYEMSSEGLLAEGLLVSDEHLTTEETNGEWREVRVIETEEELQSLTTDQKEQLLNDAAKHFAFNRKKQ